MSDYEARHTAVVDATRLVREMHEPATPQTSATFTLASVSRPPLEIFDVLEVARFLLDEEDDGMVRPGPCPETLRRIGGDGIDICRLLAGHAGDHLGSGDLRWSA